MQEVLHATNGKMPMFLQDKSKFSLLGQCASCLGGNGKMLNVGMEEDNWKKSSAHDIAFGTNTKNICGENYGRSSCGCHMLNGLVEHCRQASVESRQWIQLAYDSCEHYGRDIHWVPKLHHIHWNGHIVSHCDVHVCKSYILILCDFVLICICLHCLIFYCFLLLDQI